METLSSQYPLDNHFKILEDDVDDDYDESDDESTLVEEEVVANAAALLSKWSASFASNINEPQIIQEPTPVVQQQARKLPPLPIPNSSPRNFSSVLPPPPSRTPSLARNPLSSRVPVRSVSRPMSPVLPKTPQSQSPYQNAPSSMNSQSSFSRVPTSRAQTDVPIRPNLVNSANSNEYQPRSHRAPTRGGTHSPATQSPRNNPPRPTGAPPRAPSSPAAEISPRIPPSPISGTPRSSNAPPPSQHPPPPRVPSIVAPLPPSPSPRRMASPSGTPRRNEVHRDTIYGGSQPFSQHSSPRINNNNDNNHNIHHHHQHQQQCNHDVHNSNNNIVMFNFEDSTDHNKYSQDNIFISDNNYASNSEVYSNHGSQPGLNVNNLFIEEPIIQLPLSLPEKQPQVNYDNSNEEEEYNKNNDYNNKQNINNNSNGVNVSAEQISPGGYENWKNSFCSICYDIIKSPCILECGHFFCMTCVEQFIRCSMDAGNAKELACPDLSCCQYFSEFDVRCVLSVGDFERFCIAREKTFNYQSRGTDQIWCPNTNCDGCCSPLTSKKWLTCETCSYEFCKKCKEAKHEGISCRRLRRSKRSRLSKTEKSTSKWTAKHTKPCPKCGEFIQKDGGCHHVCCTTCQHTFCWKCGEPADGPFHCKGRKAATVVGAVILSPVLVVGGIVGGVAYLVESKVVKRGANKSDCVTYRSAARIGDRLFLKFYWLID